MIKVIMNFNELDVFLEFLVLNEIIPAMQVAIGIDNDIVYDKSFGKIYEINKYVDGDDLFDIASLTKIFSGACFAKLLQEEAFKLEDPVCKYFPQLNNIRPIIKNGKKIGENDCSKITWWNVLTHSTGFGRILYRSDLKVKKIEDVFKAPVVYRTGERVIYNDLPIILMGRAMEMKTNTRLNRLIREKILNPLNLFNIGYIDEEFKPKLNKIIPTGYDKVYRKRLIWGSVNDGKAYNLNGISAHAGIFSNARDICKFMMHFNKCLTTDGILNKDIAREMVKDQINDKGDRRGLVWKLSNNSQNAYSRNIYPFGYGHEGFTGCFAWNEPNKKLSMVLLSNDIYNGKNNRQLLRYKNRIMKMILKSTGNDIIGKKNY